ncbi:hypothetical protein KJ785_05050 [Patescibacteria group bacterium]|nr:hypothetical protein [Patescibacteria group bacterium]
MKYKHLFFIIIIMIIIGLGVYIDKKRSVDITTDDVLSEVSFIINTTNTDDGIFEFVTTSYPILSGDSTGTTNIVLSDTFSMLGVSQIENTKQLLLTSLSTNIEQENYVAFANDLELVYQNQWEGEKSFDQVESKAYMAVTEKYFDTGDIDKALEIADIVYEKVSSGWRFKYLKIRCLEKKGRDAFVSGDLDLAEKYSFEMLSMEFRPEGVNLLGDVYIERIKIAIKDEDKALAESRLGFIWDYEVSQDRRETLIELSETVKKM